MRENLVVLPYTRVRFKWIAVGILLLFPATLLMLASQPAFAQQNDPLIRLQTASTAPSAPEAPARIVRYVDRSATGSNDGTSWANAYTNLQTALANSVSGTDLWIAEGRYTPHATDRTKSFVLKNGVSLYGGFPTGGGDGTIAARFPAGHPTDPNRQHQQYTAGQRQQLPCGRLPENVTTGDSAGRSHDCRRLCRPGLAQQCGGRTFSGKQHRHTAQLCDPQQLRQGRHTGATRPEWWCSHPGGLCSSRQFCRWAGVSDHSFRNTSHC